jgi:hypothetical protein
MVVHSVISIQLNKACAVAILTPHFRRTPPLFLQGIFLLLAGLVGHDDFAAPTGAMSNQLSLPACFPGGLFPFIPHTERRVF